MRTSLCPATAAGALAIALLLGATGAASAQTLRPELELSTVAAADEPVLAAAGQKVYAAFDQRVGPGDRDVLFARSLDGGRTFGPAVRLDLAAAGSDAYQPVIAAEQSVVAVFWLDSRDGAGKDAVIGRVSQDAGASFGPELRLSPPGTGVVGDADNLVIAIAAPFVHVGFEDDTASALLDPLSSREDFLVASSNDGGLSFASALTVNTPPSGPGSADVDDIAIAAEQATVLCAWVDNRSGLADRVFVNRSADGGASFAPNDVQVDLGAVPTRDTEDPSLALHGGRALLVWRDARASVGTDYDLFGAQSTDGGQTFGPEQRIDGIAAALPSQTRDPRVAIEGSRAHVVWTDNRAVAPLDVHDVWYRAVDLGQPAIVLGPEQRLDAGSAAGTSTNRFPRVAARDGYVYTYYQDRRDDPAGLADSLYLRISADAGQSFGPELALGSDLGTLGDAEENEFVVTTQREVVCTWADNSKLGLPAADDVRIQGLRLPYLERTGNFAYRLAGTSAADEGGALLVVLSLTGTAPLVLPPTSGGFLIALSFDALTQVGLGVIPLLSGTVQGGQAFTAPTFPLPVSFWAVGLLRHPADGPSFRAASDPIFVPAGT